MNCQKHLFNLPDTVTYLNAAYMSPMLKEVEQIGHRVLSLKMRPYEITGDDFFTGPEKLKKAFAKLIDLNDFERIAIIPSVSYGIANAAQNITMQRGDEIIVVSEQFPSNIYAWQKLANRNNGKVISIKPPEITENRAVQWNKAILDAINDKTTLVAIAQVHWADGTLFDLKAIREKTEKHHALLIIDGTQSVGAFPFSVRDIRPDALICAGYKWLMGPYALGMAYYSEYFDEGNPIEDNWINRKNSDDFAGLVNYEPEYLPKAGRYNVGELSNFTLLPMLLRAMEKLNEWTPGAIQHYCKQISSEAVQTLRKMGCFIENDAHRAHHLFGIYLPEKIKPDKLKRELNKENIHVSFRGNAVRISPHLYNDKNDFDKLIECFKKVI